MSPDNNTETRRLGLGAIHRIAVAALKRNAFSAANAAVIADVVTAAERDGARSHGLMRIPGYVRGARTGRIDPGAVPRPVAFLAAPECADIIEIDGGRGYAAPAVALGRPLLIDAVRAHGRGMLRLRNTHHLHALWWDVEAVAEAGYLALAMVVSRPVVSVFDGQGRAFGTNPLCFAVPRAGRPPLVADLATSASARGDIALAQREGRAI
ncbi:MAG: Ldh family oxidoreductase, partial [Burkholderiales bacterium]